MNLKNLMMWGLLVLLVVGLFQLFQTSDRSVSSNKIAFSNFLQQVEDGRVVQVEIIGNNINITTNAFIISEFAVLSIQKPLLNSSR